MNCHLRSITTGLCIAFAFLTPCIPATAQQPRDEVTTATQQIDTDLSSHLAIIGLERIVLDLYDARVKLAPHKVEATQEWQTGFKKSFSVFKKRLREGKFQIDINKISKNVIAKMQTSFTYNDQANSVFLNAAKEQSPQLRDVPISILERSQTYFSLILAAESSKEWDVAARASYIFPFCTTSY